MLTFPFDIRTIQVILFDMNGTLRQRIPDEAWQHQNAEKLLTLLGIPTTSVSFIEELNQRWKSYTEWAKEHERALDEAEIWTKWMTPELPHEKIAPQATDLMLVWQNRKGPTVLKPTASQTVAELSRRGYRMGVISNTTSTADLPRFIDQCGLKSYFQVVSLSAVIGIRKPNSEIFWHATRALHVDPSRCAYLGNKIQIDVVGSRRAGLAMAIIIEPPDKPCEDQRDRVDKPDAVIHELSELLEIFPPRW